MKKAIDLNGNEVEVSIDTPVKTKNGVHYLLSDADNLELEERETAYTKALAERKANEYKAKRQAEYGTMAEQMEYLVENGYDAWKARVEEIKLKYPKG
jgi:hypothetical protein